MRKKDRISYRWESSLGDSPSPCSYNVPNNPPNMRSFPAYTFRPKTKLDRVGGYNHLWYQKSVEQSRVPSPASYDIKGVVGCENSLYKTAPSHGFGDRSALCLTKKGVQFEPAPNAYNIDSFKKIEILKRDSFHQRKKLLRTDEMTRSWQYRDKLPGPGSYDIDRSISRNQFDPGFSFGKSPRKFAYEKTLSTF